MVRKKKSKRKKRPVRKKPVKRKVVRRKKPKRKVSGKAKKKKHVIHHHVDKLKKKASKIKHHLHRVGKDMQSAVRLHEIHDRIKTLTGRKKHNGKRR